MTTQDERIAAIVAHAYEHAPAFRQLMEEAALQPADVHSFEALARVPITTKDALVQMQQQSPPFGGWLAVPMHELRRVYVSPGPLYDPHGRADDDVIAAAVQAFQAGGLRAEDVVVNAFMYHMVPAGLWIDEALERLGATVIPLGPGNTELQIKVMRDLGATAYVGTPSFLAVIYDKAAELGLAADALPLRKAYFTAEPYPPSLRARFEGECGLQTAQAYGTADLGLVAYEQAATEGMVVADKLVVEIADPQSGERLPFGEVGEVVVTTFNRAYPLIRFGTGDLGVMAPNPTRIMALVGRSGEAVKVRGMFLHPNQLRFVAGALPQVRAMGAVVSREGGRDILTLEVELEAEHADAADEALAAQLQQIVREKGRLRADAVTFVAAGTFSADRPLIRDTRTWD